MRRIRDEALQQQVIIHYRLGCGLPTLSEHGLSESLEILGRTAGLFDPNSPIAQELATIINALTLASQEGNLDLEEELRCQNLIDQFGQEFESQLRGPVSVELEKLRQQFVAKLPDTVEEFLKYCR